MERCDYFVEATAAVTLFAGCEFATLFAGCEAGDCEAALFAGCEAVVALFGALNACGQYGIGIFPYLPSNRFLFQNLIFLKLFVY